MKKNKTLALIFVSQLFAAAIYTVIALLMLSCSSEIPEPSQVQSFNSADFHFSGDVNGVTVDTDSINYIESSNTFIIGHQYPYIMMSIDSAYQGSYYEFNDFKGCIQIELESGSIMSWCNNSNPSDTIGELHITSMNDSIISGSTDYYISNSNVPDGNSFKDTIIHVSGTFNGIKL